MDTLAYYFARGGWTMYAILACQVAIVGALLERIVTLARATGPSARLTEALRSHLSQGDLHGALMLTVTTPGAVARIAKNVLRQALTTPERLEAARLEALTEVEPALGRSVGWFRVCAQLATLLGLLGAITGMVVPFCTPSDATSKAVMLAKAIGESMGATAFGLFVTVAGVASYGMVRAWLDRTVDRLRAESKAVVNLAVEHRARLRLGEARAALSPRGYRVGPWDG